MALDKDFVLRAGDVVAVHGEVEWESNGYVAIKAGYQAVTVNRNYIDRVVQPKIEVGDTVDYDHPNDFRTHGEVLAIDGNAAWVRQRGEFADKEPHTVRLGDLVPVREPRTPPVEEPAPAAPPPEGPRLEPVVVDGAPEF